MGDKLPDNGTTILFFNEKDNSCYRTARGMLFILLFLSLAGILPARGFLPVSPLTDCPEIPPQSGIKLEQVTGSWRLGYLFMDDNDEIEQDNTCAVAEIMQANDTRLEMLLYVDERKDESTLDRYTKEFDVTVLSPGHWQLHTSFMHLEMMDVTVIASSASRLVLAFCVDPFDPDEVVQAAEDYDTYLNTVDNMDDIFKAHKYTSLFKDLSDLNARLEKQRRFRRPSRLLRGKRDSGYEKMMRYLRGPEGKPKKHLWTVILVKDNNTSALRFVENASLLMKLGYKMTSGQLISFGSCTLSKK